LRPQILEPMPAMERDKSLATTPTTNTTTEQTKQQTENNNNPTVEERNPILDLLGLGESSDSSSSVQQTAASNGLEDILGLDIGGVNTPALPPVNLLDGLNSAPTTNGGLDNLLNGLDTSSFTNPTSDIPPLTAYEKHGLRVVFTFPSINPTTTTITLLAHNLTNSPIQDFVFQAAVPKSMALTLAQPSSPVIPAGGSVTQDLEVNNPNKAVLKMRLKIGFVAGGIPVSDQGEVSSFPPVLYT